MGMLVPPDYGGGSADSLSFVLVVEAIAGACASTALVLFAHNVASLALSASGSEALKSRYLPSLAGAERLAAIAHTEPNAGVALSAIETTAQGEGEHYVLNGAKNFITSADQADLYLVFAKTANLPGLSVLVVEDGTPGFSFGRRNEMMGFHGASEGELVFEDCRVPSENLLGEEGGGLKVVGAYLSRAMLGAAAMALGIAQSALESAIRHAGERVVAGQPIGSHQGVQFLSWSLR